MNKFFEVSANGHIFGVYEAKDEQQAKNLCAADAGYKDEKDMEAALEAASEFEAIEVGSIRNDSQT